MVDTTKDAIILALLIVLIPTIIILISYLVLSMYGEDGEPIPIPSLTTIAPTPTYTPIQ